MQDAFDFYWDFPGRPSRPDRIFYALFPDAETAVKAEEFGRLFRKTHRLIGSPLLTERLHISLQHIADYRRVRSKFLYAAQRAGNRIAIPPFEVSLSAIETFHEGRPNWHPLVLRAEGQLLSDLQRQLGLAMTENGLKLQTSGAFLPHMTLSYGPGMVRLRAIEPIRFVVKEFCLVHNERWLGRLGTYHLLERWPLMASANFTG
ncbi:2'-5' RNA ligase family protein [Methylocella sp. CPCC 101449]|uniref:2'-5' RNA ligase family protein n=1 Tax=Methylocella sp. CPCC 101449 TaxID=2987531 RepID=UPI00288E1D81|nr:2'-5' RNA ligase family protein [Methylocella sp. CPCC 101449]MDT2022264.1 2'-5' RNA ligase family protein [Methylocella sp. CPCC 101449]